MKGPPHMPTFEIHVTVISRTGTQTSIGVGKTKTAAKTEAATKALQSMGLLMQPLPQPLPRPPLSQVYSPDNSCHSTPEKSVPDVIGEAKPLSAPTCLDDLFFRNIPVSSVTPPFSSKSSSPGVSGLGISGPGVSGPGVSGPSISSPRVSGDGNENESNTTARDFGKALTKNKDGIWHEVSNKLRDTLNSFDYKSLANDVCKQVDATVSYKETREFVNNIVAYESVIQMRYHGSIVLTVYGRSDMDTYSATNKAAFKLLLLLFAMKTDMELI